MRVRTCEQNHTDCCEAVYVDITQHEGLPEFARLPSKGDDLQNDKQQRQGENLPLWKRRGVKDYLGTRQTLFLFVPN